ncbi:MAG: YfhO family protein, partial [Chloroflexi bacterium]|nr:YfhO family protein [Chloroflexota bacterium]
WDVTSRLQHSYLLTYSLSEIGLARYDGYYDNGAPLYTRQQLAATDLPTSLRLHHTRWVLVRCGDSSAEDMADRLLARGYRVAYENDGVRVLEDPNVGGYARFYRQAALDLGADEDTALGVLPTFVEHNIALVASGSLPHEGVPANAAFAYLYADAPGEQEPAGQATALATWVTPATLAVLSPAPDAAVSAFVERDGFSSIRLGVSVTSSGLLTIAESWYPNWRVWVNGVEQPILRANGALLGVWLEPGEQRIEFRFHRPWYNIVASIVTILTWLAITLWWTNYLGGRLKGPEPLTVERASDDLQA